jgi:hypothetical protein
MTSKRRNGSLLIESPLGLDIEFLDGRTKKLDLSDLPCPTVVRSLAMATLRNTNVAGGIQSPHTAITYKAAIAHLVQSLDERSFVGGVPDLEPKHLQQFWKWSPRREEQTTKILLAICLNELGSEHRPNVRLVPHITSTHVSTGTKSQALAPYSQGEYERIVGACRADICDFRDRRAAIAKLEGETDSDPDARLMAMASAGETRPLSSVQLHRTGRRDRPEAIRFRQLWEDLFPSRHVALAYRILIGLDFGLPPEGLNELRLGDIEWSGPRKMVVTYDKNRALGREQRTFALKGEWSGPALLAEWIEASERCRALLGSDRVWVEGNLDLHATHVRAPVSWPRATKARWAFMDRHELLDDSGEALTLDLRRLRTTWNARMARRWSGAMPTDPNRSTKTEGDHYLRRPLDQLAVDEEIVSALNAVRMKAAIQHIVVHPTAALADLAETPQYDTRAGLGRAMEMLAAICANPYDSPWAAKGHMCNATVWNCLVCPNAIFTRSNLPNLLRLNDFIVRRWDEMPTDQWIEVFAPAWAVLVDRVLPEFTDMAIATARLAMGEEDPIPLFEMSTP